MLRNLFLICLFPLFFASCQTEEEPQSSNYFSYDAQEYPLGEGRIYHTGRFEHEGRSIDRYEIWLFGRDLRPVYDAKGLFYRGVGNGPIVLISLWSNDTVRPVNGIYETDYYRWEIPNNPDLELKSVYAYMQHNQYEGDFICNAISGSVSMRLENGLISLSGIELEQGFRDWPMDTTYWNPVELSYEGYLGPIVNKTWP